MLVEKKVFTKIRASGMPVCWARSSRLSMSGYSFFSNSATSSLVASGENTVLFLRRRPLPGYWARWSDVEVHSCSYDEVWLWSSVNRTHQSNNLAFRLKRKLGSCSSCMRIKNNDQVIIVFFGPWKRQFVRILTMVFLFGLSRFWQPSTCVHFSVVSNSVTTSATDKHKKQPTSLSPYM